MAVLQTAAHLQMFSMVGNIVAKSFLKP
eukprot:COSAG05_NODE_418_length_10011_cov_18.784100_6_plen_27_part_01